MKIQFQRVEQTQFQIVLLLWLLLVDVRIGLSLKCCDKACAKLTIMIFFFIGANIVHLTNWSFFFVHFFICINFTIFSFIVWIDKVYNNDPMANTCNRIIFTTKKKLVYINRFVDRILYFLKKKMFLFVSIRNRTNPYMCLSRFFLYHIACV